MSQQYFKSQFRRQQRPDGKYMYWFDTFITNNRTLQDVAEATKIVVDGETICGSDYSGEAFLNPPEDIHNPNVILNVYTQWLQDSKDAFVKPPTLEQCLAKSESIVDSNVPTSIYPEEADQEWTLQWVPSRIKVDMPIFQVYWAPLYKIPSKSRISLEDMEPKKDITVHEIEVQLNPQVSRLEKTNEWIQELADLHVPYTDSPTLRLDTNTEDVQREKLRRKIHDARIRAKMATYRAERMALRFEQKYGFYPQEDEDEALTEAETEVEE